MAKAIKYTSIASNRPISPTSAGVDTYKKVVGGGPQGGVKGKRKSLGKMKRDKTNPGL